MGRTLTRERDGRSREVPPELEQRFDAGRIFRPVAVVAPIAALVLVVPMLVPSSIAYGGPLQDDLLSGPGLTGGRAEAGKAASFGVVLPWNAADREAVLERVVPIDPTPEIEVVGAGVLGPQEDVVPFGPGFPPQGHLEPPPVDRFRIPPGMSALDGYQLVVGVRASEPGVHSIPGFVIEYQLAGAEYRAIVLQGVWLCVRGKERPACVGREEVERRQEELREPLLEMVDAPPR